jgi:hypothetical protein
VLLVLVVVAVGAADLALEVVRHSFKPTAPVAASHSKRRRP